ncbi:hypothetical protein WDZ17_02715 [Pseudokineococcus basanitobsidens]|uniref:FtsX-like permease family protein n=1 Tax=Pseudokineococcus basanitobsidens TaxID=1926649 RepID=A0ABU8RGK0_9ACTN
MRGSLRRRLVRRLLVGDRRLVAWVLLAVLVPVAAVTVLDGLRSSTASAVQQTQLSLNSGYPYALEAATDQARQALQDAGLPRLDVAGVTYASAQGRLDAVFFDASTQRVADAYGVRTNDPTASGADPGVAGAGGDGLAVSAALATALDLGVGDAVVVTAAGVDPVPTTVEGVYTVPAAPQTLSAVGAQVLPPGTGTPRWLADDAYVNGPDGLMRVDQQTFDGMRLGGMQGAAENAQATLDADQLVPLQAAVPVAIPIVLTIWTALAAGAVTRWRHAILGLQGLGLTLGDRRRVLRGALGVPVLAGVAGGALAGNLVIFTGYRFLGRVVDHAWVAGAASAVRLSIFYAVVVVGALLATRLVVRQLTEPARLPDTRARRWRTWAPYPVAACGLLVLATTDTGSPQLFGQVAVGTGLLVLALPPMVVPVLWRRAHRRPATRAVMTHYGRTVIALGAAAAVTAASAGFVAAIFHATLVSDQASYHPSQPVGSVVVDDLAPSTVQVATAQWRALGGTGTPRMVASPADGGAQLWVVTPSDGACLQAQVGQRFDAGSPGTTQCSSGPDQALVYPQDVAPTLGESSAASAGAEVLAAPYLITGGKVSLVELTADRVVASVRTVTAAPDGDLGNNLPGAVLSPDSPSAPLAATTGRQVLLLPGVTRMIEQAQAQIGPTLTALAPAAQVSTETGFDDGGAGLVIILTALIGCLVVITLVLLAGLVTASTAEDTRRALAAELGAPRRARTLLAAGTTAALPVAMTAAVVVVAAGTLVWAPSNGADLGYAWALPAVLGALTWLGTVRAFATNPR